MNVCASSEARHEHKCVNAVLKELVSNINVKEEKEQFWKINEFSKVIGKITDISLKDELKRIQDKLSQKFQKLFLYFHWTIFGCDVIDDDFTKAKFKLREIKLKLEGPNATLENNQELVEHFKDLEVKTLKLYYKNIQQEPSGSCMKCCQNERNCVYTACRHLVTCYDCSEKTGDKYPLCRKRSKYKKVFIP